MLFTIFVRKKNEFQAEAEVMSASVTPITYLSLQICINFNGKKSYDNYVTGVIHVRVNDLLMHASNCHSKPSQFKKQFIGNKSM